MATINLGAIKFNWKGAYNSSTTYAVDDVVSSGGNSYVCIQAHSNQAVGNATAYWNIMSSAGTNGTNGTDVGTTLTTQGDILYRDGSGLQRLPKGTAGQVLQMNSGATAPEYATAQGGRTVQKKYLKFSDQCNYSSSAWGDHQHPLGDGTIQITPKATGNIITVDFSFVHTGGDTWQCSIYRYMVSTDNGSNWSYVSSSDDGGAGGHEIYAESYTLTNTSHNQLWHVAQNTNVHMFKIQAYGRNGGGGDKINYNTQAGGTERSRVIITEIDATGSDFTYGDL